MITGFEPGATDFLLSRKWPGNVREMENVIESAIIFSSGRYLSAADFYWDDNEQVVQEEMDLERHYEIVEKKCITIALSATGGEISRATRLVGLKDNRKKFYELLRKHNIDVSAYKKSNN